jgi:2-hydroxychromene-2-carboxylate isomerase
MGTKGTSGIQFWYDFTSTYSYLAAARVDRVAAERSIVVEWKVFLLGPIFAEQGWNDSPFNIYPAKGRYMWRDLERRCTAAGVAIARPSQFPRNGLLAARVALLAEPEGWSPKFGRAVFQANFAEDRDISSWDTVSEIVTSIGQDADSLYERAMTETNKDALKKRTRKAAKLGLFGAPTFVVGDELFWGDDRLEDALDHAARAAGA